MADGVTPKWQMGFCPVFPAGQGRPPDPPKGGKGKTLRGVCPHFGDLVSLWEETRAGYQPPHPHTSPEDIPLSNAKRALTLETGQRRSIRRCNACPGFCRLCLPRQCEGPQRPSFPTSPAPHPPAFGCSLYSPAHLSGPRSCSLCPEELPAWVLPGGFSSPGATSPFSHFGVLCSGCVGLFS